MSDTIKRLRTALRLGKSGGIAETKKALTDIAEDRKWKGLGFDSFPHFLLSSDGLDVHDRDTAEFVKSVLQDGFLDLWAQTLDEIAISRKTPRAKRPLGFERFWKLGTGNDQDRLLLRLYRERPDLYKQVVQKQMSLLDAAVEAGWRSAVKEPQARFRQPDFLVTVPRAKEELLAACREYLKQANAETGAEFVDEFLKSASAEQLDAVASRRKSKGGVAFV